MPLCPVPAVGVCSDCGREFKVPLTLFKRTVEAQVSLRKQFAEHKYPEPKRLEAVFTTFFKSSFRPIA